MNWISRWLAAAALAVALTFTAALPAQAANGITPDSVRANGV
jgi:hypothetical protein